MQENTDISTRLRLEFFVQTVTTYIPEFDNICLDRFHYGNNGTIAKSVQSHQFFVQNPPDQPKFTVRMSPLSDL